MKFCQEGNHEVPNLFWRGTKERKSACMQCARKYAKPIYKGVKMIESTKPLNKPIQAYKKVKPINKMSDKEKKRQSAYNALRKVYMSQHDRCMFKDCQRPSTECHHIRGRGKEYMLDTSEWMAVCSEHHRYIHDNDKESRELGYLKSRLGN